MTIAAYVGKPRSGKSYGVVENVIIPALKSGRTVVTNIPLKVGYLTDDFPKGKIVYFEPRKPLEDPSFWDVTKHAGAIWVIDEAWRYWKSGTTAKSVPELEQQFFAEHGHVVGEDGRTTEIILVTQSLDQIASFLRTLIEETFRAVKLSVLGTSKKYRVDVFSGAQKGLEGGTPNRQLTGTYKPEIYKYYVSHMHNKTDFAAGMEEKVDTRNNIWKSPFFKFVIPLAILLFIWAVYSVLGYFIVSEPEVEPVKPAVNQGFIKQSVQLPKSIQIQNIKVSASKRMLESDISKEYLPLSESYRIVGHVGDNLLLWSLEGTRTVLKRLCGQFSNTEEDYCVMNGELVTWYSSHIPRDDDSYNRDYLENSVINIQDSF